MPKGEEKRKFVRVLLDIPCKFSSMDYPTENADAKVIDISVNGVSIETNTEVTLGENLQLKIMLPNGLNCEFAGQVMWNKSGQNIRKYGLKLTKINMLDRIKLGDFIMSQLAEQNYLIKQFLKKNL
ncbi:MAG: PilZ domain-containing protein [Elusimicrobiota bacterium]